MVCYYRSFEFPWRGLDNPLKLLGKVTVIFEAAGKGYLTDRKAAVLFHHLYRLGDPNFIEILGKGYSQDLLEAPRKTGNTHAGLMGDVSDLEREGIIRIDIPYGLLYPIGQRVVGFPLPFTIPP